MLGTSSHGFAHSITIAIVNDLNRGGAVPAFRQSIFKIILVWVRGGPRNGGGGQALDRGVPVRIVADGALPVVHTDAGVVEVGEAGWLEGGGYFSRVPIADLVVH